jgi:hypothetical protein
VTRVRDAKGLPRMPQRLTPVPRRSVGVDEWDALVDLSDDAWLLHRDAYAEGLGTWPELTDVSFALISPSGATAAIMPLHSSAVHRLRGYLRFAELSSPGGPVVHPSLGKRESAATYGQALAHAQALAEAANGVSLEVSLAPLAPGRRGDRAPRVNPLLVHGLKNAVGQTWMVDLRGGKDSVWRGMEGRARTAVRKAEKAGVTVREAHGASDLNLYYDLHAQTYRRTGVRPHPREYFETLWRRLGPSGELMALFAEHAGTVVAAQVFGVYKGAGWYWTAASSTDGTRLAAPNLLQWAAMSRLVEAGCDWYDTGAAYIGPGDSKSHSISDFKRSMGGELYPVFAGRVDLGSRTWHGVLALREIGLAVRG